MCRRCPEQRSDMATLSGSISTAGARAMAARVLVALAAISLIPFAAGFGATTSIAQEAAPSPQIWTVPDINALPDDDHGRLVRRGRDLVTANHAHTGPHVP